MTYVEDPLSSNATMRAHISLAEGSASQVIIDRSVTSVLNAQGAEILWNRPLAVQPSLGRLYGGQLHLVESPATNHSYMRREDLFSLGTALGKHPDEGALVEFVVNINAWGYGQSGYAKYRTNQVLNGNRSRFVDSASRALAILQHHGPVTAYYFLLNNSAGHVAGWGPAFFTKFLYFADARNQPESNEAGALILDLIMDGQVRQLVGDPAGQPGLGKFRKGAWTTPEYAFYLALMARIGKDSKMRVDRIEAALFERGQAGKSQPTIVKGRNDG